MTTLVTGLQIALALSVLGVVCERMWRWSFREAIDGPLITKSIRRAIHQPGGARCDAAEVRRRLEIVVPFLEASWMAEWLKARLSSETDSANDEDFATLKVVRASITIRALRVAATASSALGLLGALMHLGAVWGQQGLDSLAVDRVAAAFDAALISIALGACTSLLCWTGFRLLRRRVRILLHDLKVLSSLLEEEPQDL